MFFTTELRRVVVVGAGTTSQVLTGCGEEVYATPAIADGRSLGTHDIGALRVGTP